MIAEGAILGMNPTICSSMFCTRLDLEAAVIVLSPTFSSLKPLLVPVDHSCRITSLNWVFRRWHFSWPHHLSRSSFSSWLPRVRSETQVSCPEKFIVTWVWVLALGVLRAVCGRHWLGGKCFVVL